MVINWEECLFYYYYFLLFRRTKCMNKKQQQQQQRKKRWQRNSHCVSNVFYSCSFVLCVFSRRLIIRNEFFPVRRPVPGHNTRNTSVCCLGGFGIKCQWSGKIEFTSKPAVFLGSKTLKNWHFQDSNRYHSSAVNMPHFNQSHAPILSKFRSDEIVNSNMNKYNGHNNSSSSAGNNQYSVPYTTQQQSSDDKQRSITSYPQSTHGSTTSSGHQPQPPEISQVCTLYIIDLPHTRCFRSIYRLK